jgi:lipase chaperone LimK
MPINRRTLAWLLGAALALAAAAGLNRWLAPPVESVALSPPQASATPDGAASGSPRQVADRPGLREPIDLMGLTVDAARLFEIGYAGGLAIDGRTRDALEILLTHLPDEPSADDIERLEWTLRDGLPAADAQKAMALFLGYRVYLKDMRAEYQRLGIPTRWEDAQAFFAQMEAVQRRHFGDETAQALFGEEMQYGRLIMEATFVAQDASLGPQERQARLAALRSRLPAPLRDSIPDDAVTPPGGS